MRFKVVCHYGTPLASDCSREEAKKIVDAFENYGIRRDKLVIEADHEAIDPEEARLNQIEMAEQDNVRRIR